MSFDPSSIISLIKTCKTIYDYFADVKHSSKERRRLLDEVHSLQPELEALQKLANMPGVAGDPASMDRLAQLLDRSQPFVKVVGETLARVKDVLAYGSSDPKANKLTVLGKRGAAALSWTVDKAEVKNLLSDLERYKSRIGLALQHDMFKKQDVMDGKLDVVDGKQDNIDGKLSNVEESLSNEVRLKIAKFICQNDYSSDCKPLLEKKIFGTGTWMLYHPTFVVWRHEREPPNRTLWCYGHPGAGKSVMAALIIEHLRSTPNNIVLSVFCRYSSNIFTTPFAVLGGLLRQLIEKTTTVPRAICALYWSQTDPRPDALTGFLNEMTVCHGQAIYIVVDALDECPFGSDLLSALQHLHSSFRVLVTSRPVFTEIKKFPSIKIRASDHDILVAVDATLPKLKGAWLDDALKNTIRDNIVEKADGMFLLASLQLRELECDATCRRHVTDILDSLPRTLDDAYKLTYQRIREQGKRTYELACRALALIMLDSDFVSVAWRVQHVLAEGDTAQYTDIETILQCCHGLVHREYRSGYKHLAFMHYSAHEYTTAHWSELFPENLSRSNVCLQLGFATLIQSAYFEDEGENMWVWGEIVDVMTEPDELKQAISHLSTTTARTWFVGLEPEFTALRDHPLLIACYCLNSNVVKYMIKTAPPDALLFNEVLSFCRHTHKDMLEEYLDWIIARPDVRLNRDGLVVAVDMDHDGDEASSSDEEEDEYVSPLLRRDRALGWDDC